MKDTRIQISIQWREKESGGLTGNINRQTISRRQLAEILQILHSDPQPPADSGSPE